MLQYTLFFYFVWGLSTPDRIPSENRLRSLPGDYPLELSNSADQVLIDLIAALPTYNPKRWANMLMLNALAFSFAIMLSIGLYLVPYVLIGIVIFCMGPVVTLSATWSWMGAGAAVVSLAAAFLSRFWIGIVSAVAEAAVDAKGTDRMEEFFKPALGTVQLLAEHGKLTEEVVVDGHRVLPTSMFNADIPVYYRFAVATYHLYCPSSYESYSTSTFTLVVMVLALSRYAYRHVRLATKSLFWVWKWTLIAAIFTFAGSDRAVAALADGLTLMATAVLWPALKMVANLEWRALRRFTQLVLLLGCVKLMNYLLLLNVLSPTVAAQGPAADKATKFRAVWNNAIMDFTRLIDNISVPNFIRSLPDRFDREAINQGQAILADLGWPMSEEVSEALSGIPANQSDYTHAFVGGTSIRQGIRRMELEVASELKNLEGLAPTYKRTEQYATYEAELESLARYFEAPELDIPDLPIDEVWVMIGDIFADSKLAPFNYILKKWEKKYGLGPFWGSRNPRTGRWRKLSRKAFIQSIGGMGKMVKLWADTFRVAHTIPAVAPVSVKGEALPEKKWRKGLVRTIIGAPITHYISSTLWNFMPNHNFKFWSTNIKIGMPLNGFNLSTLIRQHASYTYHFGGDFSAFDSTVTGKIVEMIAKIRKKGFERHRDYAKICFLIDANYKGLLNMPMMTTSTGDLYRKVTGLSTGHSSTGMDNSLAVTILYILVWKQITGLSAHEFRHYCKLSNYGDDHLLSWLATAPPVWNPDNIIKAMARMGVQLRDEFPLVVNGVEKRKDINDFKDLMGLAFLSKKWRAPTTADRFEMAAANVRVPDILVFHDPVKLAGKAYAPTTDARPDKNYRIKRLVSYLYLTAHHRELYDKIVADIEIIRRRKSGIPMPSPVPIPTYSDVLRSWYDPETMRVDPDDHFDEDEMFGKVMDYSLDGMADTLANILSVVPDVLNPAIYNMGYVNWMISQFGKHVAWPVELVRRSNGTSAVGALTFLGKRTLYDFLFENPTVLLTPVSDSDMTLIAKHWCYLLIRSLLPKSNILGFLDVLTWADKKIAEANFALNGYVQPYTRRLSPQVLDVLLVSVIDVCMPAVAVDSPLFLSARFPTFAWAIDWGITYATTQLWSRVPANMKDTKAVLEQLDGVTLKNVLISAKTGTGKSTTLVNYIFRYHGHRYTRVYLIEPRSVLVTTLAPYLQKTFGLPAVPVTSGYSDDSTSRLVVTTPQEVLIHENWLGEGSLFIVDECHVQEPAVLAVIEVLHRRSCPTILVTATPSESNLSIEGPHVPLRIAQTWTTTDDLRKENVSNEPFEDPRSWYADYRSRVLDIVRVRSLLRFLIFVTDKKHAVDLAGRIGRKTCIITSDSKEIDQSAEVFIATSVADVGLTIPDVHWVITSDIVYSMDYELDRPVYTRADALLLQQRKGRTGRTSNGTFTVFRYPRVTFVSSPLEVSPDILGLEVLKTTGNASLVASIWPGSILRLWDLPQDHPQAESLLDLFTQNLAKMARTLEANNQKAYRTTVDGFAETNYWHIAGNTLPTPVLDPKAPQGVRPLTIPDGWRFLIGAAHWAASRGTVLASEVLDYYIRDNGISGRDFVDFASKFDPERQRRFGAPNIDTEGTRFGARATRVALRPIPEESLFEELASFNRPVPLPDVEKPSQPVTVVQDPVPVAQPLGYVQETGPIEDLMADLLGDDDMFG